MTGPAACARCGTPVAAGARVCRQCGADVSGQQAQVATAYVPAPPSSLLDAVRRATLGEYDVRGELGQGGMASVFKAHDIALDRQVAIKVMSPALFSTPGMVVRFKREARTAASLSHPNIIPIYAVRESPEIVYFVMKFVDGRSLESIVRQLGQMPLPLVQAVLYQVGAALGYAHRRQVVHRDVKPANIMIDRDGWPVVTDFGIAKAAEQEALTQTGATIGTPSYMSPEQCEAKHELTGASDQYSLGVVAYEMLGGRLPFHAETTLGLLFAHVHETPPPIDEIRPDCPPAVAAALMRMLEKDPRARWPDIETAVTALGGAPMGHDDPVRAQLIELAPPDAEHTGATLRTPISPAPLNRAAAPPTRTSAPPERRPPTRTGSGAPPPGPRPPRPGAATRSRRSPLLWVVAPALLLAGGAAWWLLGTGTTPQAGAPSAPPPLAPPETVRITERAPAETVRVADSARPAVPTRKAPAQPPSARPAQAPADFRIAEARALARRLGAVSAGATAAELRPGDREAEAAEALSRQRRFDEARLRLDAATAQWAAAEHTARRRPRANGGNLPQDIRQVAREFEAAFNTGRLLAVRAVYPDIPADQAQQWQDLFLRSRGITLRLQVSNVVRTSPGQAQATFEGSYEYTENRSGTLGREPVSWQATLRQTRRGWRIAALR